MARPELPATVLLQCNGRRVATDRVEFLDIHEDIGGRDVMTFTCPDCGRVHESNIYLFG